MTAEVVGQSSIIIYGLATVQLYLQSLRICHSSPLPVATEWYFPFSSQGSPDAGEGTSCEVTQSLGTEFYFSARVSQEGGNLELVVWRVVARY